MQFTKIDINNWTRKEYFDHYFDNTPCTYSMTVKLDISKLKKDGKKLYPTLLYGVTTILNRHEEFRTALDKNGQVGVFSEMLPCYTIFHKETETFSSIWTEFTADYTEFLQNYQKDIDAYGERKGMFAKPNPPENTFPVSMIPWTSFEGFNLNLKKGYDYLLPIFTFGKYYEDGGKYYIPLSIQVHHAVCDGFHVCRFLDELQDLLNKYNPSLSWKRGAARRRQGQRPSGAVRLMAHKRRGRLLRKPSPLGAQSTFLLLHQRCCGGKVLLRYFLTEKVTKR